MSLGRKTLPGSRAGWGVAFSTSEPMTFSRETAVRFRKRTPPRLSMCTPEPNSRRRPESVRSFPTISSYAQPSTAFTTIPRTASPCGLSRACARERSFTWRPIRLARSSRPSTSRMRSYDCPNRRQGHVTHCVSERSLKIQICDLPRQRVRIGLASCPEDDIRSGFCRIGFACHTLAESHPCGGKGRGGPEAPTPHNPREPDSHAPDGGSVHYEDGNPLQDLGS